MCGCCHWLVIVRMWSLAKMSSLLRSHLWYMSSEDKVQRRGTHPVFISTFFIPPLPHTHTHTHTPFTLIPSHTHPPHPPHTHPHTHTPAQVFYQVLNFGMIVSSALMIWKGLMVVTGSESPIVVVLRWGGWVGRGRG